MATPQSKPMYNTILGEELKEGKKTALMSRHFEKS
jgi:hypothetical protein